MNTNINIHERIGLMHQNSGQQNKSFVCVCVCVLYNLPTLHTWGCHSTRSSFPGDDLSLIAVQFQMTFGWWGIYILAHTHKHTHTHVMSTSTQQINAQTHKKVIMECLKRQSQGWSVWSHTVFSVSKTNMLIGCFCPSQSRKQEATTMLPSSSFFCILIKKK